MTDYLIYALKVSVCIIVFYAFYWIALRKSTFYSINRFYLLLSLFVSFIIPVLQFSIFESRTDSVLTDVVSNVIIINNEELFQFKNITNGKNPVDISLILPIVYFSGIVFLFFKLLFSIQRIFRLRNNSEAYQLGKIKVFKCDYVVPFSFFNSIYLPKTHTNQLIINHELVHVRQFHWLDLIVVEIISVLLWFNPFVVLYKRSLRLQHEYLADFNVVKDSSDIISYLECLLANIQISNSHGLVSQFYCKTTKKRIIMITKNKTSIKYLGVYILFLPLVCLLLYSFINSSSSKPIAESSILSLSAHDAESIKDDVPSICPVNFKSVTKESGWGMRVHPIYKIEKHHIGYDFALPKGNEIFSTADGVVAKVEFKHAGYGVYVVVNHSTEYSTLYAHLSEISVKVGDKVDKGQVIGFSGSTGYSTEPHLHYEVHKAGKPVDPKDYLSK